MRYSNVHESFLDFLKDKSKKEYKKTLERIEIFLNSNLQYGYEKSTGLPGLLPLEKLSKSIVATERHLKKVVKELNIENWKVTRISSKVWSGDVLVLLPSTKAGREYGKYANNYAIDPFSNYLQQYDYGSYKTQRPRKQTGRYMYESIFSDFMDYLTGDKDMDKPEYSLDNAYVQVTRFLVKYPYFDFDASTDTAGLLFLSTLSKSINIPMKVLEKLFKKEKFENADITKISISGVEGSVVVFGNPPYNREQILKSWQEEIQQTPRQEIVKAIDSTEEIESENTLKLRTIPIPSEEPSNDGEKEVPTEKETISSSYEISNEENAKRKEIIVNNITDTILFGVKTGKPKSNEGQRVYKFIESINSDFKKRELVSTFIGKILDEIVSGSIESLTPENLKSKIFLKSKQVPNFYYFNVNDESGVEFVNIMNDNSEILNDFITYLSSSILPKDKISSEESIQSVETEESPSVEQTSKSKIDVEEERANQPKSQPERNIRHSNFVSALYDEFLNAENTFSKPTDIQKKLITKLEESSRNKAIQSIKNLIYNIFESKDETYKNYLENVVMFPDESDQNGFFYVRDAKKGSEILMKVIFENYALELLTTLNEN